MGWANVGVSGSDVRSVWVDRSEGYMGWASVGVSGCGGP